MAEKVFNTRIQNKIDTSENWAKATNFVPKLGEIILYSDLKKMKIGDGSTTVNNLEFACSGLPDDGLPGQAIVYNMRDDGGWQKQSGYGYSYNDGGPSTTLFSPYTLTSPQYDSQMNVNMYQFSDSDTWLFESLFNLSETDVLEITITGDDYSKSFISKIWRINVASELYAYIFGTGITLFTTGEFGADEVFMCEVMQDQDNKIVVFILDPSITNPVITIKKQDIAVVKFDKKLIPNMLPECPNAELSCLITLNGAYGWLPTSSISDGITFYSSETEPSEAKNGDIWHVVPPTPVAIELDEFSLPAGVVSLSIEKGDLL